jgi:Mesyanzhinovviridae DNA helicase
MMQPREGTDFKLRSKSMEHQIAGLRRALKKPRAFAFLAETGTGKTHIVLAEFQHRLKYDVDNLLVIAPMGCIRNWYERKIENEPSELEKHLDPKLLNKLFIITNRKKAFWKRQREAMPQMNGRPKALFVNIEALSRGTAKYPSEAEALCRDFMNQGNCMMVIDESTTIRARSARTKTVMRLGKLAWCRRILTGLVTPKSPLDLYHQMNFLDPEILDQPSYIAFRTRYAKVKMICREPEAIVNMRLKQLLQRKRLKLPCDPKHLSYQEKVQFIVENGGWLNHIPIIYDYQNLNELHEKIKPYCYQILKKDCLDLQPKTYQFRDVELTKEQTRIYNDILADATAQLSNGSYVTANSVLSQMIRLHQVICGHVKDEDGKVQDIGTNRIKAIVELLNEHDGKAIIWDVYDYEIRRIKGELIAEFGSNSVASFWGGNAHVRDKEESKWLSDPECRFMVSTQMSGGRGNTWNPATLVIYAANNHDLEHRYQSEDRCHRLGQTNRVTYVDLICRETVEEKIITALRKKIDLATIITGENFREWLI